MNRIRQDTLTTSRNFLWWRYSEEWS